MSQIELSIWAAMLGALLTFLGAALAEAIRSPSIAAWRAINFIVLTGVSAMIMCGWVEQVAALEQRAWLMPAKVALGPLSGALALLYLGIWFGKLAQDPWLDRLIAWGSLAQCLAAAVLLLAVVIWPEQAQFWLKLAFLVNMASVVMALSATARGVALGDALAAPMLVASICLGVMVVGLYAKGLGWASSNVLWALTALSTAAYFSITTMVSIMRNRQRRLIVRMSEGIAKTDEITGLPVGGTLLSKIDDALWRSVRIDAECAVMAVWIENLYLYNDVLDTSIEHEIRHVLAAKIRRAIGFRPVLGLQQSRCFIAGISVVKDRQRVAVKVTELVSKLQRPLQVGVMSGHAQTYEPSIGIGLVYVGVGHMTDPLSAMDQALALAKRALREPERVLSEEAHPTSALSSRKSVAA
jgi:GGDEF domain-containing protein